MCVLEQAFEFSIYCLILTSGILLVIQTSLLHSTSGIRALVDGGYFPAFLYCSPLQVGLLIMYYTPKKGICIFLNLPGLQKPGRNFFPKNSCWVIKDQGILNSQNNLDKFIDWWYKAIVHTFCFFLLVSWFNVMGICFNIW